MKKQSRLRLQQWLHLVLWDPRWHAQLWDNTEWTAKHKSQVPHTHTHTHYSKCNETLTLPQKQWGAWQPAQNHWDQDETEAVTITRAHLRWENPQRSPHLSDNFHSVINSQQRSTAVLRHAEKGRKKMPLSVASFIKPVCTCYLTLPCWCFARSFCQCSLLTLSVYLLMEPELWQSWIEERAGPAGSLCWYHDFPSVSGTAGAGLGLLGHAVKCSVKRREETSEHSMEV